MQRGINLHKQIIAIIVPKYLESQCDVFFPRLIRNSSINLYREQETEELRRVEDRHHAERPNRLIWLETLIVIYMAFFRGATLTSPKI